MVTFPAISEFFHNETPLSGEVPAYVKLQKISDKERIKYFII